MKRIDRTFIAAAIAAALIAGTSLRADDTSSSSGTSSSQSGTSKSGNLSSRDAKFIREAAEGNMKEIQLGQIGVQKAQNDQVKQFAQKLVDDHTQANQQLQQLAQQKGVELPAESKHDNKMVEHFQNLSGSDFDHQFVKHMAKDHEKDVKEFQKAANKADDPDVKNFAAQMVPKLQEHLTTAQNLENTVTANKGGAVQEPAGSQPNKDNNKSNP